MYPGQFGEVHPTGVPVPPDPSDAFASMTTALSQLAAQIVAAKAAGNTVLVDRLTRQYNALRTGTAVPQARAAQQASAREKPSALSWSITSIADDVKRYATYAGLALAALVFVPKLLRK